MYKKIMGITWAKKKKRVALHRICSHSFTVHAVLPQSAS